MPSPSQSLDLLTCGDLSFASADEKTFPCLALARQAVQTGGTACCVLSSANEVAVDRFLRGELSFYGIAGAVAAALEQAPVQQSPDLAQILAADAQARQIAASFGG